MLKKKKKNTTKRKKLLKKQADKNFFFFLHGINPEFFLEIYIYIYCIYPSPVNYNNYCAQLSPLTDPSLLTRFMHFPLLKFFIAHRGEAIHWFSSKLRHGAFLYFLNSSSPPFLNTAWQ